MKVEKKMNLTSDQDRNLKVGNFFLAALFSVVPATMTIAFLWVHGLILCKSIRSEPTSYQSSPAEVICIEENTNLSLQYAVWIWLIILIPTWRWFYIGHYRKKSMALISSKTNTSSNSQ